MSVGAHWPTLIICVYYFLAGAAGAVTAGLAAGAGAAAGFFTRL